MSDERNGFKMFISFLAGGAIGAAVALLFAPQAGTKTRKQIKDLAEKVGTEVKDNYEKLSEKARGLIDRRKGSGKD